MPNRMHSILRIVAINILSLCALLILIEIGVRVARPDIVPLGIDNKYLLNKQIGDVYTFKPHLRGFMYGRPFVTDDRGFRIDPGYIPKASNKSHTIIILGDSISFAPGVDELNAYPYYLQRTLSDTRIINASIPGYGFEEYIKLTDFFIRNAAFDGIIVGICLNDFTPFSQTFIKKNFSDPGMRNRLISNPFARFMLWVNTSCFDFNAILRQYSKAYILFKNIAIDATRVLFETEMQEYQDGKMPLRIEEGLQRVSQLARQNGKWVLFVVFPFEYQLRDSLHPERLKPQDMITASAGHYGLPVIDLVPYLRSALDTGHMTSDKLYLPYDPMHFSATGHRLIGNVIYEQLLQRNLIKKQ
jgi:hypothetical protein